MKISVKLSVDKKVTNLLTLPTGSKSSLQIYTTAYKELNIARTLKYRLSLDSL